MRENELPVMNELCGKLVSAFERAELDELRRSAEESPHRGRSRRWLVPAVGLTFALATILVGVVATSDNRVGSLSTQQALAGVARAAIATPVAGANEYTYTKSRSIFVTPSFSRRDPLGRRIGYFSVLTDSNDETWLSVRRKGRVIRHRGKWRFVTARDRALARRYLRARRIAINHGHKVPPALTGFAPMTGAVRAQFGNPAKGHYIRSMSVTGPVAVTLDGVNKATTFFVGSEKLTRQQLDSYPTNPQAIYDRMRRSSKNYAGPTADAMWFRLISPLAQFNLPLPPALRAGMVKAIGLIKGVSTLGKTTDPLGRVGVAFARENGGIRDEIIFDSANSALIYAQSVLTFPSAKNRWPYFRWPKGTVVSSYTLVEQKIVDRLPRTAGG